MGWSAVGNLLGALLTMGIVLLVLAATTGAGPRGFATVMLAAAAPAGFAHGMLLGGCQAHALRSLVPGLRRRRFALATGAAVSFVFVVSLVLPALDAWGLRLPMAARLAVAGLLAVPVLTAVGLAQHLELRRHLEGTAMWVPANAAGWALGGLLIASVGLLPGGWPVAAGAGLVAALAMGALIGLVTWAVLVRRL